MFKRSLFSHFTIKIVIVLSMISSLDLSGALNLSERRAFAATATDYQSIPPFVSAGVPPLVMLVMGRDHKLYYEAYNDASDLNGDGKLDVGYNPLIDYYGYFDSYKYYSYSTSNSRFEPAGVALDKKAPAGSYWSGDFLNYLTMTRMDCLRKVLYGGFRSTDTATETVLQRVYVPQDAHSWGKEYTGIIYNGFDIREYTPLELPKGTSRHLFASTTLSNNGNPILRVLENSVRRIWEWVAIERPVAGSRALHGGNGPAITDNQTTGIAFDLTNGGSVGTADDSYVDGGATPTIIKSDDFTGTSSGTPNPSWVWQDNDERSGTTSSQTDGQLIIDAGGADVWNSDDQFAAQYLDNISGNFDFKLRITQQEEQNGWGKTGIMVRNDMTAPGSSTGYCIIGITPDNGFTFQTDSDNDGYLDTYTTSASVSPPQWVRLTKEGTLFTAYYGSDGSNWTSAGSRTISSADTVQDVGIFVTSHAGSTLSECKFDEMELTSLVPITPDPSLAFDDSGTTKWNYPDEPQAGTPVWIEFAFTTPAEAKTYSINAGGSDYPKSWTLQGSVDQIDWTVLDTVSSQTLTAGTATTFTCDTTGIYKYYRLVITDTSLPATAGLSIAEIQLLTDPVPATATLTDYIVRVKVCDPLIGLETNSKYYPGNGTTILPVYKPIGILQRHGESDRMYFGLITGSYKKNQSGGVLRKNIRSINDEINPDTGEFLYMDTTTTEGIIRTIDKLRTVDFDYGTHIYNSNCGLITNRAVNEGECRMWGNPIAEMMYESLRYFSGAKVATSTFDYVDAGSDDYDDLGLPHPSWRDPYSNAEDIDGDGTLDAGEDTNANGLINGFDYCAKPFMLVLSDINPSYDSDQLPGNAFGGTVSTTLGTMDVEDLANTISANELAAGNHFVGRSGATSDGSCSPKTVVGFGDINGLCPEEPTKKGGYYSAAVAYYGNINDVNTTATEEQKVGTYCVGLASPLPTIDIKVGTQTVTLVPFGKSVGTGTYSPTNTIVDFFVEEIADTYGKFRINYEDVEQGNDHDMDAIVEYTYQVYADTAQTIEATVIDDGNPATPDSNNGINVKITLNSIYADGSVIQHMGYIVSGSTKDGTYLEVRDKDTGASSDPDYFLDTPPGVDAGTSSSWDDNVALPSNVHPPASTTRTFFPGTGSSATFLKNPLWYAAKWGGFEDDEYAPNDIPDTNSDPSKNPEWDADQDGTPDTYFYVQNATKLEEQLNYAFEKMLRRVSSGTAASVISQTKSGEGAVYQAVFYPEFADKTSGAGNKVSWVGDVRALFVDNYGNMREDTNQNHKLDTNIDKMIVFDGTKIKKTNPDGTAGDNDPIKFLWTATKWLNDMTDAQAKAQRVHYSDTTQNRYIFTFADADNDMIPDAGELQPFEYPATAPTSFTDTGTIFPYINIFPTFEDEPTVVYGGLNTSINSFRAASSTNFNDFLTHQYERVINYIRGVDQLEYKSATTPKYILLPFRSRQVDYDEDTDLNDVTTWRLGDIVYSAPTVVGKPAENYHLLYSDKSYGKFLAQFQGRRQVAYAGGNDGMFHAFNGGFFDNITSSFNEDDPNTTAVETQYELGAEMWAYIPYNLLPHLYWLTETDYPHVYYCDLQPKIFDAKILPDNTHYDSDGDLNWGTFLVAGMRFGGGEIKADMDKTDGNVPVADDRTMKSAYFIFDITDPETPPNLIAELTLPGMGYTTCYPAVIPIKTKGSTSNEWYLVFGSGPADSSGSPASSTSGSNALTKAVSEQKGKIFVVNLQALISEKKVKTLASDDGIFSEVGAFYKEFEENSFITDPAVADINLDYAPEAVYFGTIQGSIGDWDGKMRRVVINNKVPSSLTPWDGDSVLIETPGQPISAKANVSIDDKGRSWVYFGTGRYYVKTDEPIADQQTFYGIIEPFYDNPGEGYEGYMEIYSPEDKNQNCIKDEREATFTDPPDHFTWLTVNNPKSPTSTSATSLLDVSTAVIKDDKSVSGVKYGDGSDTGITKWSSTDAANKGLIERIDDYTTDGGGWYMNLTDSAKERSISQANLFGEMAVFTTYIPSGSMCEFQGKSNLYAVYYKTGTPYYEDVMFDAEGNSLSQDDGSGKKIMVKMLSLGDGLASTPNIHSGTGDGSGSLDSAFVQTSTGDIIKIKQNFPVKRNLGVVTWKEGETECN